MPDTDERQLKNIDNQILKLEGELDQLRNRRKRIIKKHEAFMKPLTIKSQQNLNDDYDENNFGFSSNGPYRMLGNKEVPLGGSRKKHRYHKQKTRSRRTRSRTR